jgi:hypothetical protein
MRLVLAKRRYARGTSNQVRLESRFIQRSSYVLAKCDKYSLSE